MTDTLCACRSASLAAAVLVLAACSAYQPQDGAPKNASTTPVSLPPDAIPRKEARSRYGNPPAYEVFGVRYTVLDSSEGYNERGVASWYGNKFHGKSTSSQEPYDMYAMTAAHKSLPLPTYVRVRNLRNDKSVVVRVNDRGPFVDNRIIDLSYSAAARLDMIRDGTSLVEVTALSVDEPAQESQPDVPTRAVQRQQAREHDVFVQVGAFGDVENARRRYTLLTDNGISNSFVHKDNSRTPALYRIRIGPITGVDHYDQVVINLSRIGIRDSHLVTD